MRLRSLLALGSLILLAPLASGCSSSPTTVLLDVRMAEGEPAPPSFLVSVYDRSGAIVQSERVRQPPPGRVVLVDLPANQNPSLRIVAAGVAAGALRLGGVRLDVRAHRQVTGAITLSAATSDRDGDAVPDDVDNCPDTPNPDQANTSPASDDTTGDVCRSVDLGSAHDATVAVDQSAAVDGFVSDGPGFDLAVADPSDLALADLTSTGSPDLRLADLSSPGSPDLRATADLAPVGCAASTRVRCESFDSATIDTTRWQVSGTNATVSTVDATSGKVFRGARALRIQATGGAGGFSGTLYDPDLLAPLTAGFFARAHVYLASPGVDYAQLFEVLPSGGGVGNLLSQDGRFVTLQDYGYGSQSLYQSSTSRWPLDQWFCVEWQVQRGASQSAGAMRVWLNDVALTDVTASPTNVAAIASMIVGYTSDRTTAATIYIDELIVDGSRIGCAE